MLGCIYDACSYKINAASRAKKCIFPSLYERERYKASCKLIPFKNLTIPNKIGYTIRNGLIYLHIFVDVSNGSKTLPLVKFFGAYKIHFAL